ncbi:Mitochondrial 2-methylisocitrate lyase [Colletotrichum fructicola]|uniref:Isocitrate lyase n=2 Tax=Colletotrichum chrysophilum TaxID=1836956 RepID=A0AAD9AJR1_9PEZI|nr:Mitochondrial 2-methylisocitrate lyase [Colletotrichum fructicola]KAF4908429.1 Mitochondrial 2-methylisocitrate lyase [Colletotrichum fructicola]KAF4932860.1 Mitochondrial 2-methylisocitrate lyase [Colletotrichum fructicola]KAK1848645.1 isocitrate lyase [Colletotrichum chrysophilum]
MSLKWPDVKAESDAFAAEVKEIEAWWETDRQKHIKRPYTAKSIAALRNVGFKIDYPSSVQGRKLWRILNEHNDNGTYELTFGTTEPLIAKEMAKTMQTVYVSGALCGLSQATWPGEDHADYPADLVPSVVKRIFNTQLFHDQRQTQLRMRYSEADREALECIDYMLPIVADADMGFGTLTGCMKLTRSFVEAGVAMIHIDDLAMGLKKFTNGEGRTIVPTSDYLSRLTTVRMTFDIMGADTMLLCRCDSDHAEFITSVIDPRDHPYVLGATKPVSSFIQAIEEGKGSGKDYLTVKSEWKASAGLMTFDEAVNSVATKEQYEVYMTEVVDKTVALQDRRAAAKRIVGQDITFDWELPRTPLGQYMWQWSTKAVIDRCILAAPLGDVTWSRQDKPNKKDMHEFHTALREAYPNRLFAFGYTGAYDFSKGGYSTQEVETFPADIAKMGIVWQVQPIWATQGLSLHAKQFAEKFKKEGIAGYMRDVAAPSIAGMATDKYGKPTSRGGYLADAFFDVVAGGDITELA